MSDRILLVGAGQLGSRYLQGLARVARPLDIFVSDISHESLARAEARWYEAAGTASRNSVRFELGLSHIPQEIDLAIVATSAETREQVVSALSGQCIVHYWVLEKVLAQSIQEIDRIKTLIRDGSRAWVNTPRRMIAWHKEIKSKFKQSGPFSISVVGGNWGLACNSIHFLDMLAWLSDEQLLSISSEQLNGEWHKGKRPGFWEIYGTLTARFSKGSVATLTCHDMDQPYLIQVCDGQDEWKIYESSGVAERADGLIVRGKLSYQSEITAPLIESILKTGQCELPLLKVSAELHRPLINGLLDHWNKSMPNTINRVPIT